MPVCIPQIAAAVLFLFFSIGSVRANPALWQVRDHDTIIHLFGTIHMAPEGLDWMSEDLRTKLTESGKLYLELAPGEMAPENAGRVVAQMGLLPAGKRLGSVLSAETYQALRTYLGQKGLSAQGFEGHRPWLVAVTLTVMRLQELGLDQSEGGEAVFLKLARDQGMAVAGLETLEEQLQGFADLNADEEEQFLMHSLEEMEGVEQSSQALSKAWSEGDLENLEELLFAEFDQQPKMEEAINSRRNHNWVKQIKIILEKPGTYFVAVGAMHLLGEQGVPQLLRQQGVTVTRYGLK